jgi:protein gp37
LLGELGVEDREVGRKVSKFRIVAAAIRELSVEPLYIVIYVEALRVGVVSFCRPCETKRYTH